MLPFPRNLDLKIINEKLLEIKELVAVLHSRTPDEDPLKEDLFEALVFSTKASNKLISIDC